METTAGGPPSTGTPQQDLLPGSVVFPTAINQTDDNWSTVNGD